MTLPYLHWVVVAWALYGLTRYLATELPKLESVRQGLIFEGAGWEIAGVAIAFYALYRYCCSTGIAEGLRQGIFIAAMQAPIARRMRLRFNLRATLGNAVGRNLCESEAESAASIEVASRSYIEILERMIQESVVFVVALYLLCNSLLKDAPWLFATVLFGIVLNLILTWFMGMVVTPLSAKYGDAETRLQGKEVSLQKLRDRSSTEIVAAFRESEPQFRLWSSALCWQQQGLQLFRNLGRDGIADLMLILNGVVALLYVRGTIGDGSFEPVDWVWMTMHAAMADDFVNAFYNMREKLIEHGPLTRKGFSTALLWNRVGKTSDGRIWHAGLRLLRYKYRLVRMTCKVSQPAYALGCQIATLVMTTNVPIKPPD